MVLGLSLSAPLAQAHHWQPIQPGGIHESAGSYCTFNFAFESHANDSKFIGTAGHCVAMGDRVVVPEIGEIGTVVYHSSNASLPDDAERDFALIEIDDDKHGLLDPALRRWGGPVGVETEFTPGTPVLHYGNGLLLSSTEPTRSREGHLEWVYGKNAPSALDNPDYANWYLANVPVINQDSGSALMSATGHAIGVAATPMFLLGSPGYIGGPTFEQILEDLDYAGWDVTLMTAPLVTESADVARNAVLQAEHCTLELGGNESSDACLKVAWPSKRIGEPNEPPENATRELIAEGTITAGHAATSYFTVNRNPVSDVPLYPDSFEFPAPEAGTIIGTETTDSVGLGYDVDMNFYSDGGHYWREASGCATPAADDVCAVPEGATTVGVAAYHGVNLEVRVYKYLVQPGIAPEAGNDSAPTETGGSSPGLATPALLVALALPIAFAHWKRRRTS